MGMFDWFAGKLKCPNCGAISPDDESTMMQTKINVIPTLRCLRVGDELDFKFEFLSSVFRVMIRTPGPGESAHLLRMWECPTCGAADNWVEIVISPQSVIESMEVVEFDLDVFDCAHGIERNAIESVYPTYTDRVVDVRYTPPEEWIPPLRKGLAEAKARASGESSLPP